MNKINVITVYPLEQAIADGVLVEIFKNRWEQLSHGKPIVATSHLFAEVSLAALLEIWNEFVSWRARNPKEKSTAHKVVSDWLFETRMNEKQVWVLEDDTAFTFMYPEDY